MIKPTTDPRANGYNYGEPLPLSESDRRIWEVGAELASTVGDIAIDWSKKAWAVEQAARAVRIACYPVERSLAVAKLQLLIDKIDPPAQDPTPNYSHADYVEVKNDRRR
jgi:hypothetical protein